jgi:hypothetical protein
MRVIVFALVALNIVIAVVFEVWKNPGITTKQPPADVGQLRLAHELPAAVPVPLQAKPENIIPPAPAVDKADARLIAVPTEAPVVQVEVDKTQRAVETPAPQVEVVAEPIVVQAEVQQTAAEEKVPQVDSVTEPQKVAPVVESTSETSVVEPVAEAAAVEPVCWLSEAKSDKQAFESLKLPDSVSLLSTSSTELSFIAGYKVIVPAQESREAAIKVVEQLAAGGITDVWRFRKGEMVNAISLGIFSKEATAFEVATKASALGIAADVLPRNRTKTTWTAIFKGRPGAQAELEALLGKISRVGCE